jgi:hypothetical protein
MEALLEFLSRAADNRWQLRAAVYQFTDPTKLF